MGDLPWLIVLVLGLLGFVLGGLGLLLALLCYERVLQLRVAHLQAKQFRERITREIPMDIQGLYAAQDNPDEDDE